MRIFLRHLCAGAATLAALAMLPGLEAASPNPRLSPEFFAVLRSGDVTRLREALDGGAPVNARDASGTTPLMHAALYGPAASVRLLLDRGAEVNARNDRGATALMRAATDFESLRLLVERGANVNARSVLGNTPLMLVARPANSHRAVELLLRRGADAKDTNEFGATALMAAVASGDEYSVRLLLQRGADPNAQPAPSEDGFLLGGGRSPLMWAAYRGNLAVLKRLVDAGADVNAVGGLGTPLAQAAWANQTSAAQFLLERGARIHQAGPRDGYAPLHWAVSTDSRDPSLVNLLLKNGADPDQGGGEHVDAFLGTPQTPLMLARRRGATPIVEALSVAGATHATADRVSTKVSPARALPEPLDAAAVQVALGRAVPPLQKTSIKSKKAFVNHASRQDCTSCHQQYLPMVALGLARQQDVAIDGKAERELIAMVQAGELKNDEVDWQALFHPDAVFTKGYEVFAYALQNLPADEHTDAWVHHLASIQGANGQWYNNLPRPPMQSSDISATALAVLGLQRYPLPGRKAVFARQVTRARQWLWNASPQTHEDRAFQILGLAWTGESARKLQPLVRALLEEQNAEGGWSQLPGLAADAYATGQALYALRVAGELPLTHSAVQRATRFLLQTQLEDGTWHVRRRAFPFQPTMDSGFPHGRDSWISAAGTSWAVLGLSVPERPGALASARER